MTIDEKCRLSYYEKVTALNEKHGVWLVKNKENDEICVMKEIVLYKFSVYETLKNMDSRYFPQVYDFFVNDDNKLVVIEEYISGKTLEQYVKLNGCFKEERAYEIFCQLCDGLALLHGQEPPIIHRDIKPSNVIITNDGNVKLIDFNAAKTFEQVKQQDTILMGTSGYAAPEQYGFGQSDVRTDIYGMGVLLNYMLTGKLPKEKLAEGEFKEIIEKCTRLEPELRYQNVAQLKRAVYNIDEKASAYVAVKDRKVLSWLKKYAPPGFRSKNLWKMFIAMASYLFIIYCSVSMDVVNKDGSTVLAEEKYCTRVMFFVICMFLVVFICNYMNVRQYFLFMNHKNVLIKVLAGSFWCLAVVFGIIVVYAMFCMVINAI